MKIKNSVSYYIFQVINTILLVAIGFITLYPFWHVIVRSLLPYSESIKSSIVIIPTKITFEAYKHVFSQARLLNGLFISVGVTITGTIYQLLITAMAAYGFTRKELPGRKILFFIIVLTMFFSGGLIPTYLLIKNLKLVDNLLVLVLPYAISAYNMIIMRTFFSSLPPELEESATIDGAGQFKIFFRIIVPLSVPVIAIISLFVAVANWNNWYGPMLYLNKPSLWPLALVLRDILIDANISDKNAAYQSADFLLNESVKMAVVIVSLVPIVAIYPFIQKYFAKGVLLGAVKL